MRSPDTENDVAERIRRIRNTFAAARDQLRETRVAGAGISDAQSAPASKTEQFDQFDQFYQFYQFQLAAVPDPKDR